MKSLSFRFALAAVAGALFILALIGTVNYHFLKETLLKDATERTQLIKENSVQQIQSILTQTKKSSDHFKSLLIKKSFSKENIEKVLTEGIEQEPYFFGMAMAFEPQGIYKEPFCPYYYRLNGKIVYKNVVDPNDIYYEQEWYTTPKEEGKAKWSEPYFDTNGGRILMATYGNPVYIDGKFQGVVTIDLSLEQLASVISSIHILQSGYAFLLSKENKILVHPDTSKIMTYYHKKNLEFDQIIKEDKQWVYYAHVASTGLVLGIVLPENELFSSLNKISLISIILAIAGSILLIIMMLFISRRITRPLKKVTKLTQEISLGNFDEQITLPRQKDEIYDLSLSVNRMQGCIKRNMEDLKTATIKEERIESELSIARSIQMSMLPKMLPENPHIYIAATLQPAKAVGGDFYDFFTIDDDHLCFTIADVSGKGVPAAMFMAVTMSYIRAYSVSQKSPTDIVTKLNNTIAQNNDANMFVTLFLGILNIKSGELTYVNGGHTEPYVITGNKNVYALLSSHNPVVGAFEGVCYKEESMVLEKNEKLFLYTDGVNEAFSEEDEQYGLTRMEQVLKESRDISADACISKVDNSVMKFCGSCEQSDDTTMLVIARK